MKKEDTYTCPLWEYTSRKKLRRVWERVPGVTFPVEKEEPKPEKKNTLPPKPKGYKNTHEACAYLGISQSTFWKKAKAANLPYKTHGRIRIYKVEDVEKLKTTIKKPNFPKK